MDHARLDIGLEPAVVLVTLTTEPSLLQDPERVKISDERELNQLRGQDAVPSPDVPSAPKETSYRT
ncbi:MAG: hypothetical protein NVS3B26_20950 [Mycobacteriales bacterium]